MAKNKGTVYLGYQDEEITSKHLNWMVNKVGGVPDWPDSDLTVSTCPQCSGIRPLIVQLYCPLENSPFHRSLYVFACLNPNCSNNSKNWLCIRVQKIDTSSFHENLEVQAQKTQNISWCSGADDWEEENTSGDIQNEEPLHSMKTLSNNISEENGNVLDKTMSASDDDDDDNESNSMENEICEFSKMQINGQNLSSKNEDEDNKNANLGIMVGGASIGAFGEVKIDATCAEIEGGETDMVYVETPKAPEHDVYELFKVEPSAIGSFLKLTDFILKSYFLFVEEERHDQIASNVAMNGHIRELYQEYRLQEAVISSPSKSTSPCRGSFDGDFAAEDNEMFEKTIPAHGDLMLFNFISTLQKNPGQILRYSRDSFPLLIAPIMEPISKCEYCNGETICEVQILPTIIPILQIKHNNIAAPIEFGNVLIYTCLKSCWDTPDKLRYEKVIVQRET